MTYGWAGTNLEVDLSTGKVEKKEHDFKINEAYLGGRGTNTKIFWDRVPPETSAFSPNNLLIFGTGVLTGTRAPAANRVSVATISPPTNLLTFSNIGGFWGAELKHAGYDTIIISEKSPTPIYLWINDDKVEIRDANHLCGKDVRETQKIIREDLNKDKIQILCIGPAGENKVYAASIEHSYGASASRTGIGAVMGDKNLKAIAVYGTKDLNIAKPSEFAQVCDRILKKTDTQREYFDKWSYEVAVWLLEGGAYGNLGEMVHYENPGKMHADFIEKFQTKRATCFNCGLACKSRISLPDGEYSFTKCYSFAVFMHACKIHDITFGLKCHNLCERYGLDCGSIANCIAFAIDLYEKGILTKKDTDGVDLEWGNEDLSFSMIRKIARREGIGDILANGVYEAARLIGKGAEDHVNHIKKLEQLPWPTYTPYRALRAAVSPRADMTKAQGFCVHTGIEQSREWKEEFVKAGHFSYPKELEKLFLDDYVGLARDYEKIVSFVVYDIYKGILADCTGVCIYWTGLYLYHPTNVADHISLISYATGMNIGEAETMEIVKRGGNLLRAYNVIKGLRKKDDAIHEKYFRDPPSSPYFKLDHDKFDMMISDYYKLRSWNSEGIPGKEELDRLGLDYVRQDLERRGIL